jgi:hypothetical protein
MLNLLSPKAVNKIAQRARALNVENLNYIWWKKDWRALHDITVEKELCLVNLNNVDSLQMRNYADLFHALHIH